MSFKDDGSARVTEEQLLADMDSARQAFLESLLAFDEIIAEVPSRLPVPDGVYRIRKSAKVRDVAYAKYKAALKRFKDHLAGGES